MRRRERKDINLVKNMIIRKNLCEQDAKKRCGAYDTMYNNTSRTVDVWDV
jgi:hypothetical protein